MAFMHFNKSIDILNSIDIENLKVRKRYLIDTLGYVLAEDIVASYNSPNYPTSAMDGYAIKYRDIEMGRLKIVAIIQREKISMMRVVSWNLPIKTIYRAL